MEQLIIAQRAALAAREDAGARELAQAFAQIADQVEAELHDLTARIVAAGDTATPMWLYRHAHYQRLMAGALVASRAYGDHAAQHIAAQYHAALADGQRDATALLQSGGLEPAQIPQRIQNGLLATMRTRLRRLALPTSVARLAKSVLSGGLVTALRQRTTERPIVASRLITKIREGFGAILINVLRTQRTEHTTAYRSVVGAQFAHTPQVVGWQWATELTHAKAPCAVCVAMHGQIFPVETPFGTHPGCRCLALPVIAGVGPIIAEDGVAWLAQQDAARQIAVLGKAKQRLYQAGELQLADLVVVTEHPVYGVGRHERSLKALGLDKQKVP